MQHNNVGDLTRNNSTITLVHLYIRYVEFILSEASNHGVVEPEQLKPAVWKLVNLTLVTVLGHVHRASFDYKEHFSFFFNEQHLSSKNSISKLWELTHKALTL